MTDEAQSDERDAEEFEHVSQELTRLIHERIGDNPTGENLLDLLTDVVTEVTVHRESSFSGPLPPDYMMKGYKEIDPSLLPFILEQSQREQLHRHKMGDMNQSRLNKSLEHEARRTTIGQASAFTLTLLLIGAGFWLLANGHSAEGLATVITPIAGIAVVFITNKVVDWKTTKLMASDPDGASAD